MLRAAQHMLTAYILRVMFSNTQKLVQAILDGSGCRKALACIPSNPRATRRHRSMHKHMHMHIAHCITAYEHAPVIAEATVSVIPPLLLLLTLAAGCAPPSPVHFNVLTYPHLSRDLCKKLHVIWVISSPHSQVVPGSTQLVTRC